MTDERPGTYSLRKLLRNAVVGNALALTTLQVVSLLLPLASIPYLARVLRPDAWGAVLIAQSLAIILTMLLEFGFNLSATREVARVREDANAVAVVVANVTAAKGLLLALCAVGAAIGALCVPQLRAHPGFVVLAWVIALAQGLTPTWYFQGVERLPVFTATELGGRVLMTAGIFATVRTPADGWQVLAWQALFCAAACSINVRRMYREVAFVAPRARGAWEALRMSWGLFLFRATVSLYTTANVIILNVFVSSAQIALYGGAERLSKALLGILGAVPQAVFPRISHLVKADRDAAKRLARISAMVTIGASLLLCLGLIIAAPLVIRLVLGAGYEGSVPLLRVLALLVPIITASGVLGIQWMLPLGMDRPFMRIVAIAGVLNVALGSFLSSQLGSFGMSCAVVVSELFVTVAMFYVVAGSGHVFWKVERTA